MNKIGKVFADPFYSERLYICNFFGIKKGYKVLDVGCGQGGTSVACSYLVGRSGKVVCIDNDSSLLKIAKKFFSKLKLDNIEARLVDANKLSFPKNYFDMIVFLYSSQYFERHILIRILRKAKKWTKILGIADQSPYPRSTQEKYFLLYKKLDKKLEHLAGGTNTKMYSRKEMEKCLKIAGWKIVKERNVKSKVLIPAKEMKIAIKRLERWNEKIKNMKKRKQFAKQIAVLKNSIIKNKLPKFTTYYCFLCKSD